MARYPGAVWRPVASKGRKALTEYNRVNFHVAVSEASSLWDYFNKTSSPDSHFYVRRDGSTEQYVDTSQRAFADYEGNDATISIETQGGVNNPNGEPWTDAQRETLAQIYAWAVQTHGIAVAQASSSHKDSSSRGMSWHRLGIDGNFPALPDIRAGRNQRGGGMRWSTSSGKACPGDAKIQSVPGIFARAQEILAGSIGPAPDPPKPEPTYEVVYMDPYIVRRDSQGTWYLVTAASPKPVATPIPTGGVTQSLRELTVLDLGDAFDSFMANAVVSG